jgi:hypothetical protein
MVLIREYEEELDSIIHLEEVISSHRGNEIMKTLTVLTIVFTPIMALGALWGMNFKHMPELEWKYGYLVAHKNKRLDRRSFKREKERFLFSLIMFEYCPIGYNTIKVRN